MNNSNSKYRILHQSGSFALQKQCKFLGIFNMWANCFVYAGDCSIWYPRIWYRLDGALKNPVDSIELFESASNPKRSKIRIQYV